MKTLIKMLLTQVTLCAIYLFIVKRVLRNGA